MGECNNEKKRVRDDPVDDSPESKILRVDSAPSDANSSESDPTQVNPAESCELGRVDSDESVLNSSGVNGIQDELLNLLDETDNVTEGLDSVIKSFEEEILAPGPDPGFEPGSESFNPNLGYLLEASDDELGLPPTVTVNTEETKVEIEEPGRVGPEGVDLTGFLGLEDDFRSLSYEAFGFGNGVVYDGYNNNNENGGGYISMDDGLFDYSETTDNLWRLESLQAM